MLTLYATPYYVHLRRGQQSFFIQFPQLSQKLISYEPLPRNLLLVIRISLRNKYPQGHNYYYTKDINNILY